MTKRHIKQNDADILRASFFKAVKDDCENKEINKVKVFFANKENIEILRSSTEEEDALHIAIKKNNFELAFYLIEQGCNQNNAIKGLTPIALLLTKEDENKKQIEDLIVKIILKNIAQDEKLDIKNINSHSFSRSIASDEKKQYLETIIKGILNGDIKEPSCLTKPNMCERLTGAVLSGCAIS